MQALFKKSIVLFIRAILALILALVVLSVESLLTTFFEMHPELSWSHAWPSKIAGFVITMVFLITIVLILSAGKISKYGFKIAVKIRLLPTAAVCLIAGALATLTGHFTGGGGLDFAKEFTFLQVIVFIWIFRSIIEESIFRGLVQSFLEPLGPAGLKVSRWYLSLPVIIGAVSFALVHLMLLTLGTDLSTVLTIVAFALLLGLIAGYCREKSGSLLPAIIVHALFNVGGTGAGYLVGLF
jgi:membrane protease YdiL (CAAX protease family)